MARKFLYFVAFLIVLVVAGAIVLSQFSGKLTRLALVPTTQFAAPPALAHSASSSPSAKRPTPIARAAPC